MAPVPFQGDVLTGKVDVQPAFLCSLLGDDDDDCMCGRRELGYTPLWRLGPLVQQYSSAVYRETLLQVLGSFS